MLKIYTYAFAAITGASVAVAAPQKVGRITELPRYFVPQDNPQSLAKIELGKMLFVDPRLSHSGTVSCNSCHNVMGAGVDNTPTSTGINGQLGGRNSPTVWNSVFQTVQFWDGRAKSLEDQAKGPLVNPIEMGMPNHDAVVERVKSIKGYEVYFAKAFPKEKNPITIDTIAKAIAAFERTLIAVNSPFDKYQAAKTQKAKDQILSVSAQRGMKLVEDVGCTTCHMGTHFNGPDELNLGDGFYQKHPTYTENDYVKKYELAKDLGRFEHTKDKNDKNMWRVPSWRNVALTAPYFHNGKVQSLDEAVRVMAKTQLNVDLNNQQVEDIVAFLESLTGEFPKIAMPRIPLNSGKSF